MPFPYVSPEALARELQYTAADIPGVAGETEWSALLTTAVETESERVGIYANNVETANEWRPDDATIPLVVREAVIRLARARIARIREDGISSESLVSGASYDYRPPADLRNEVKATLDEAEYRTGDDDFVLTT